MCRNWAETRGNKGYVEPSRLLVALVAVVCLADRLILILDHALQSAFRPTWEDIVLDRCVMIRL